MDIMSLFRTAPAPAPAAQPATPVPGNNGQPLQGTGGGANTSPNGVVPAGANGGNPGDPGNSNGEPASPLAKFDKFWETDPTQSKSGPAQVFAGLDPAKIQEAAKKVDFSKAITPEQLAAIAKGGDEGMQAFALAMNSVAQTVYGQSAIATTKLVQTAVDQVRQDYDARLPSLLRKTSANEDLVKLNPAFASPVLAPITEALTEQFVKKNPNATAAEIQSQVTDVMKGIAATFGTPTDTTQQSGKKSAGRAAKTEDWEKFLLG